MNVGNHLLMMRVWGLLRKKQVWHFKIAYWDKFCLCLKAWNIHVFTCPKTDGRLPVSLDLTLVLLAQTT